MFSAYPFRILMAGSTTFFVQSMLMQTIQTTFCASLSHGMGNLQIVA
jgi:hypothetical protein